MHKNNFEQTLLALIEISPDALNKSLINVVRMELGLHQDDPDLPDAKICLCDQLESSNSTFEIISLLDKQGPVSLDRQILDWIILVIFTLVTGVGFTFMDISADIMLAKEYHNNASDAVVFNNLTHSLTAQELLDADCSWKNSMNNTDGMYTVIKNKLLTKVDARTNGRHHEKHCIKRLSPGHL